jgi:hypothetical protein
MAVRRCQLTTAKPAVFPLNNRQTVTTEESERQGKDTKGPMEPAMFFYTQAGSDEGGKE